MGMASGGVAFSTKTVPDILVLTEVFGVQLSYLGENLAWDISPRFDTRNAGDIATVSSEKFCVIINLKICEEILFNGDIKAATNILKKIFNPEIAIFHCAYDSGGSYGFALFKDGVLVRRRVVISAERHAESGAPIDPETKWQLATKLTQQEKIDYAFEEGNSTIFFRNMETKEIASEYDVDAKILDNLMKQQFNYSLWDDEMLDDCKYYRAVKV